MTERVISVKMPQGLVDAMHKLQSKHHYLDLSEQLRSVVRQRCLELSNPYTAEIRRLRDDLQHTAADNASNATKERILQELISMLREGRR